ncbi:MAG TPA: hypothetical protein DD435_05695 [Cyanobacteria bacterium UBA8530]|nr:hypothetical protein [Cyanobacteria bacterium UBA8530]
MGFDLRKLGQAFSGIFGKKSPSKKTPLKDGTKKNEQIKNSPRPTRDGASYAPGTPRIKKTADDPQPSIRPPQAKKMAVPRESKKSARSTSTLNDSSSRNTIDSKKTTAAPDLKYLQQGALMAKAIADGDLERLKGLVEKMGKTANALTSGGSARAKKALLTSAELQQVLEDKKGPATELSATLCRETAALTDEAMRAAAKWLSLSKKLINASEIMDEKAAEEFASELINQASLLDGTILAKNQLLGSFGTSFAKWLQLKDFFAISNHAEGLARDATVLSILSPSESSKSPPSGRSDRLETIKELAVAFQDAAIEKRYSEAAAIASSLSAHCGLLSDANQPKAVEILSQAVLLKAALEKGEKSENPLSGIQHLGSVFTGAMLDRQKRADEAMPLLKQSTFSKDISALAAASNKLWRNLAFVLDPTFKSANGIANQSFKIDAALKAKDSEKALAILNKQL